jgi:polyisoprenoid-binding protein YceI
MKNIFLYFALTAFIYTAVISCSDAPKGDKAEITDKQQSEQPRTGTAFVVDTANSKVRFIGYGVGKNHPGNFRLTSGKAMVQNGVITGGDFVINVKSLTMEQEGEMFQKKLKPHLLSGDFFDAEKFDQVFFEITKVEPYEADANDTSIVEGANFRVSGNLKLKDVTKNISFPAHIDMDDNTLKAKADFNIDRRDWQINYGSDKTLGDKFISESVNIELDLKANKL